MTYDEVAELVKSNNKSTHFSDEFVICLIWKETNFNPDISNPDSTATGFMQMTVGAVDMVNKITPKGIHFSHTDMRGPVLNIQCGTYYLDIAKTKLAGVDKSFGTGPGYSKRFVECEICLKSDNVHPMVGMYKIHK
jgi:hypothetical protein